MKTFSVIILLTVMFPHIVVSGINDPSILSVLNPDGTIIKGTQGGFNAEGFKLGFKQNGELEKPTFIQLTLTEDDYHQGFTFT